MAPRLCGFAAVRCILVLLNSIYIVSGWLASWVDTQQQFPDGGRKRERKKCMVWFLCASPSKLPGCIRRMLCVSMARRIISRINTRSTFLKRCGYLSGSWTQIAGL